MTNQPNRQWIFVKRPAGPVEEDQFEYRESPVPEPGDGEFLVRSLYLSCDPSMQGFMTGAGDYMTPLNPGDVMLGRAVGQVTNSRNTEYKDGDLVYGMTGWEDYFCTSGTDRMGRPLAPFSADIPIPAAMNVTGSTGLTAYFGMLDVGQMKPGDTVLVSGAAGAVGSVAGQIAKIADCRVIGTAGSDEKCAWLVDDLGFDAAINYKTEKVVARLGELCPNGIDLFFDNVGGAVMEAGLTHLTIGARVAICGGISGYTAMGQNSGPANYMMLVLRRAKAEGFLVLDYVDRFPEGTARLAKWYREGKIKSREDILEGFDEAPRGLMGLFIGDNIGKRLIHVGDPA